MQVATKLTYETHLFVRQGMPSIQCFNYLIYGCVHTLISIGLNPVTFKEETL